MGAELGAMIQYMVDSGVPHRVTSTVRRGNPFSRHFRGLAADFAGPVPGIETPAMRAIFDTWTKVESQLFELIYSDAPYNIKRGRRVPPYAVRSHRNHVHVAVNPGVVVRWPISKPPPPPVPEGVVVANAPFACILVHPDGGYLEIGEDGGVFAYGDAPFFGSLGELTLNEPIVDAAWAPDYGGYYMIGRDGGIFAFGSAVFQGNALWQG